MKEIGLFAVFISFVWGTICWLIGRLIDDLRGEEINDGIESRKHNNFC